MAKDHGPSIKNDKQYEGQRKKGMSASEKGKPSTAAGAKESREDGVHRDYSSEGAGGDSGFFATLKRTATEFMEDNLTDWAAALTYYGLLALFPALIAMVSLIGLIGDPSAAGFAFVAGLAVALWSASGYVGAFIRASNIIYETPEGRLLLDEDLDLVVVHGRDRALGGALAADVADRRRAADGEDDQRRTRLPRTGQPAFPGFNGKRRVSHVGKCQAAFAAPTRLQSASLSLCATGSTSGSHAGPFSREPSGGDSRLGWSSPKRLRRV